MDNAALAGLRAREQSRDDADDQPHAGGHVDYGGSHAHWRAALLPGDAHQSGEGLHQRIVAGPILVWTARAECTDIGVDEFRFATAKRGAVQPELFNETRAHVLQHDIDMRDDERLQLRIFGAIPKLNDD